MDRDLLNNLPFSTDLVLDSLSDGFQAFDSDWRYVFVNREAERILGRSRDELLGKVCWDEYPERVGTPFHAKYLEAVDTATSIVFEDFCLEEETWVEFSLHPYPGGLGAFAKDITARKRAEQAVAASEHHYHALFDNVLDAVLIADNNGLYVDANPAACVLFGMPRENLLGKRIIDFALPDAGVHTKQAWIDFLQKGEQTGLFLLNRLGGEVRTLEFRAKAHVLPGLHLSVLRDVTERREADEHSARLMADLEEEREALDIINHVGRFLSAELDLHKLIQAATDAATSLTGAQFGAFFYNVENAAGESYMLYTLSGVPAERFSSFPMPRATEVFAPTFRGEGIIRLDDVKTDPRYGKMAPHFGMPEGHLPVRSYLAVPVVSRSGEVLGGLFFGHETPGVFTERAERNVVALVAHVAVAADNARLFAQSQHEIEERHKAEDALRMSAHALQESQHQMKRFLRDVLASVTEGKLHLCDSAEDLPPPAPIMSDRLPIVAGNLRLIREAALRAAEESDFSRERAQDLVSATSEAAMNTVMHAGGGVGWVGQNPDLGIVQIRIEDQGGGIDVTNLPRATLERGYTSGPGFGHGFWLMLHTIDRMWLLTGTAGTTVVIQQSREVPIPNWLDQDERKQDSEKD